MPSVPQLRHGAQALASGDAISEERQRERPLCGKLDRCSEKLRRMTRTTACVQKKAAAEQRGIPSLKKTFFVDQEDFFVGAGNSCADEQARHDRRRNFLKWGRFPFRASSRPLERRKLLLHFRHSSLSESASFFGTPAFGAPAGKCSCISGVPAIHGRENKAASLRL